MVDETDIPLAAEYGNGTILLRTRFPQDRVTYNAIPIQYNGNKQMKLCMHIDSSQRYHPDQVG